jgi:hypothetical protein
MKIFKSIFVRIFSTLILIFSVCPGFSAAYELSIKDKEICREFVLQRRRIMHKSTVYIDIALKAWRQELFDYFMRFSMEKRVEMFRFIVIELYANPCSMLDKIDSLENVEMYFDGNNRPGSVKVKGEVEETAKEKVYKSGMIVCRVQFSRYSTAVYYL